MRRRRSVPHSTQDDISSEKTKLKADIALLEAQLAILKERVQKIRKLGFHLTSTSCAVVITTDANNAAMIA
jgi:hypothetical protein